ncbi:hypothetical protein F5Y11DRAFT_285630 [Daldinia sp. FL1419]|nr:hypothetical protein F5Y11DRAFT_285630 [Daldinia sp. FL1419]
MGRTEPSVGRPPAGFRRDARAKRAKATINKVIPHLLVAHPRARRGIEASELIIDPSPALRHELGVKSRQRSRRESTAREDGDEEENLGKEDKRKGPHVSLRVEDTLDAAYSLLLVPGEDPSSSTQRRDLSNGIARVGVLNMASPLSAGGGFLNGASSQEESLCMRSTLLPSLRDEFYRLPELGVVFTPDVLVFRGSATASGLGDRKKRTRGEEDEVGEDDGGGTGNRDTGAGRGGNEDVLPKRDRWFVDVVSAAMIRMPEIEIDEETGFARYTRAADRELAVSKMRAVLRAFAAKGARQIVLGAWGCGAYGNPIGEIASAWRKILLGGSKANRGEGKQQKRKGTGKEKEKGKGKKPSGSDSWDCFENVVFAIKDPGMAQAFATAFGEDLLEGYNCDGEEDMDGGDEEDVEDASVKELRDKIRELELRTSQAQTLQLRAGLSSVLAGLRIQLRDSDDTPHGVDHRVSSKDRDSVSARERGNNDGEPDEPESEGTDETRSGHDEES